MGKQIRTCDFSDGARVRGVPRENFRVQGNWLLVLEHHTIIWFNTVLHLLGNWGADKDISLLFALLAQLGRSLLSKYSAVRLPDYQDYLVAIRVHLTLFSSNQT